MSSEPFNHSTLDQARQGLKSSPIDPDWILEGQPKTRSATFSRLTDGRTWVDMWDCTAGRFYWYYDFDETAHILEGEAIITDATGRVWEVKPGDVITFREGTRAHWVVPHYIRKLAVMNKSLNAPMRAMVGLHDRLRYVFKRAGQKLRLTTQGGAVAVAVGAADWMPLLAL
jgi:uncharacterized cupin superfamily protein